MPVLSNYPEKHFPESNVELVARGLVYKASDTKGPGLVDVFRTLLARAEEIQEILAHVARTSQGMVAGKERDPLKLPGLAGPLRKQGVPLCAVLS